jgi:hypothetical protein
MTKKRYTELQMSLIDNTARHDQKSPEGDRTAVLTLEVLTEILGALIEVSANLGANQGKVQAQKRAPARKRTAKAG